MMVRMYTRSWLLVMVGFGLLFALGVRAADEVDNPQYAAWAKFNVGSNVTLAADRTGPNGTTFHLEMTRTLESLTSTEAVIEVAMKTEVMGHSSSTPPRKNTINAKAPARELKQLDDADVEAMGKTFKCKVYEIAAKTGTGGAPQSTGKATIYVNDGVPGGLVKMEATGLDGTTMAFILTAMNVK